MVCERVCETKTRSVYALFLPFSLVAAAAADDDDVEDDEDRPFLVLRLPKVLVLMWWAGKN